MHESGGLDSAAMSFEAELMEAKVAQAIEIMGEVDIDVWLTFAQEMGDGGDPVYPIIFGERDLGDGLLLLSRDGRRIAIVGGLDAAIPAATPTWNEIDVYKGSFRDALIAKLESISPRHIAVNFSRSNRKADGLSYGNFLRLQAALEGTRFADRLISAEPIIARLRSRKLAQEVALIREAIAETDEIFAELSAFLRPGLTGREIYEFVLESVDRRGVQPAWSRDHCPIATVGPVAPIGHTPPGDVPLERGWTLQVDFGIRKNGYCSDFQRMWYVLERGETHPPAEVTRLFDTIRRGIDTAIAHLGPGVPTWKCAQPVLDILTNAGYPPFQYSLGHQLGRAAHDGGPGLGFRREGAPESLLEPGWVVTVEGIETLVEGRGWVSLEEDVLITESGVDVLTTPQKAMWLIR